MTRLLPLPLLLLTLPAMADPTLHDPETGQCFTNASPWVCWTGGGAPDMKSIGDAAAECAEFPGKLAPAKNDWQPIECPDNLEPKPPHTLKWVAPTTNADGTPLTDLAGFRIYCNGAEWDIDDPAATTWPLDDSLQGEITCDVAAMDTSGNISTVGNQARGER